MERTQGKAASFLFVKLLTARVSLHNWGTELKLWSDWLLPAGGQVTGAAVFVSSLKGSFQRRNWTPQAMLYLKGTRMY